MTNKASALLLFLATAAATIGDGSAFQTGGGVVAVTAGPASKGRTSLKMSPVASGDWPTTAALAALSDAAGAGLLPTGADLDLTAVLGGMDPLVLGGAGAAVLAVALASSLAGKGGPAGDGSGSSSSSTPAPTKKAPKPEPVDISIPYDAAARLAYQRATGGKGGGADFAAFNAMYREVAVAEVTLKAKRAKFERAFPGASASDAGAMINGAAKAETEAAPVLAAE
jgi:hypothetical protein